MAKILLVEDDNNLREIFEMRLQAEGYQTLTASNGEDALVTAMREKPDLIVADVMMPKLSGFEMLETLRAAPEMKNTKVIMMTALGQAEDQTRGESLGVLKYLVKSQVTLEDFARVVTDIVPPSDKAQSSNNNQEGEKTMPEDTTPTNTPVPGAPADPAAPVNPMADSGQMSNDEQKEVVNEQVSDFAASTPAPAPGSTAPAESAPAEQVPPAPAGDQPPAAPPAV